MLILRLFYLQIVDDSFKLKSDNNAIKIQYDYPERGYIYDRNGKLLVANQPSYDIMVIPKDIKNLDTLEFCKLLSISKADFIKIVNKAKVYSPRLPSVFLPQLNKLEFAAFQEKIRKFEGFYIQKRSLRDYQVKFGANVFGFITQVNERTIEKNPYYNSGDLIGKQGVEESYENILRGVKGVKYILKDKFNREIGPYKEGKYDTISVQGKDIHLSIDAELQQYGEELMINKRGGIVAIEPKTGEILALVTAPSYDPAILVGRQRSKNYTMLYRDSIAKPLYDRGLLAEYPPGSPFKILTGLIGLQEQVIDEQTTVFCNHGFSYARGRFMRCHCHGGAQQLHRGIYESCNAYFGTVYLKTINKYLGSKYHVLASYGHVRDLPAKDGSVEPDADFRMIWEVEGKASKRLADIAKAVKGSDRLILATDPDREGEAISWHVLEVLNKKKALKDKSVQRVTFNAITKSAVTEAMKAPRDLDMELVEAYLARRALDYLVGSTLSPVLWRKLPGSRSAGRVQSVALRLVVDRELEIERFKTQEYWTVDADVSAGSDPFLARLVKHEGKKLTKFDLGNEASALAAKAAVEAAVFKVEAVEKKPGKRSPAPPFTTNPLFGLGPRMGKSLPTKPARSMAESKGNA